MHAYLITGKTQKERLDRAKGVLEEYGAMETIELPTPKVKHYIKDIRYLNHRLSLKSQDSTKPRGVIIEDAHFLTLEAANSFLKTLEEPPGNTIIILTAPNGDLVLPTITSRCTNIELGTMNYELGEEEERKAEEILQKLLKVGVGERLKFMETIGTRREALEFCIGQTYAARKLMIRAAGSTGSAKEIVGLITRIDQTRKDLEANVNVKLCLGDLLLNYPTLKNYPTSKS